MNLIEYIIAIVVIALFLIGAVGFSLRLGRPNEVGQQPEERVQLEDEGRVKDTRDEGSLDDEIELGRSGDRPKRLLARLFGGDITRAM